MEKIVEVDGEDGENEDDDQNINDDMDTNDRNEL